MALRRDIKGGRPHAVGYFPARKMRLKYSEELWLKARDLYFNKEMSLKAIGQALRINYRTVRNRSYKEKWLYYRTRGEVPEDYLAPVREIRRLKVAAQEANVWIRRKKMDMRRKEVIEEAAVRIMTREQKAKEQLDAVVDKTPALLGAMDDAVKSLEGLRDKKGRLAASAIGAVKDLVSMHSKICDTLGKLERTDVNTRGLPVETGWIGILGAVRLKDEEKVLRAQAVGQARGPAKDHPAPALPEGDAIPVEATCLQGVPFAVSDG